MSKATVIPSELPRNGKSFFVKAFFVILVIVSPLLIIAALAKFWTYSVAQERIIAFYKMPDNFNLKDIKEFVIKMSRDPDFQYYFVVLDRETLINKQQIIENQLLSLRSEEKVQRHIDLLKSQIELQAVMLTQIQIPKDIYQSPELYPDVMAVLKEFLELDYEIAIMGLYYKTSFQNDYTLEWSKEVKSAASLVQRILSHHYRLQNEK